MRTVRSIQQIPRHFTDYGEKQELQKISSSVSGVPEALRNQESEHRKSDTSDATHRFIKQCAIFQQVISRVVNHH